MNEPEYAATDIAGDGDRSEPTAADYDRYSEHKRKKRKKYKLAGENISHLNLTPMMDIMTILLVFLIQSFATDPSAINITLDLRPPESTVEKPMEAATTVTITAKQILVDNEVVVELDQLQLAKGQKEITALRDSLIERADHAAALNKLGGAEFDGKLEVVAHQTTPYDLLTAVLYSAGQAKYSQYKLVVMKKGGAE